MINPTEKDIGRKVVYTARSGLREEGYISSFNESYVFVRYGNCPYGAATLRQGLEWLFGGDQA